MVKVQIHHISIPMQQPFNHAVTGRKQADAVIMALTHNGVTGIGECVPREYVTGESIASVMLALKKINMASLFKQIDWNDIRSLVHSQELIKLPLNARCIVEMAILDCIAQHKRLSLKDLLAQYITRPNRTKFKENVQFFRTSQVMDLSLSPEDFLNKRGPFHCIKVKLTNNEADNVNRVAAIRRAVGYDIPMIVDANMAWQLDFAIEQVNRLQEFNISYYEEPLAKGKFSNYAKLRKLTSAQILLDESVCSYEDLQLAIKNESCDAVNIRISKCGGLFNTIKLIQTCQNHQLAFQLGAQVAETGPLIAAGRHLRSLFHNGITFEAGQPDRSFNEYIVDNMPLVDRKTNFANPVIGRGLGVNLNKNIKKYIQQSYNWQSNNNLDKVA